ncbi:MAG: D-tyrosyl-tRNA(Tyr) deacylase [Clostridia bacterium]|nr:D-tyrosyl-tRNA(Tyr) deacylase [Clostridia bacterium]
MKAILQRVSSASVVSDGELTGNIEQGLMILLGVSGDDTENEVKILADKTAHLRIFSDENDKMNLSVLDVNGAALVVSNFTLCADTSHGRRPSYMNAMEPGRAKELYAMFLEQLRLQGIEQVDAGVFGADMQISLVNDGPVTIILNTDDWK